MSLESLYELCFININHPLVLMSADLQVKWGLVPFVEVKFHWNKQPHFLICLCIALVCLCATKIELSNCNTEHMVRRAYNVYLDLLKKCLLTPAFNNFPLLFIIRNLQTNENILQLPTYHFLRSAWLSNNHSRLVFEQHQVPVTLLSTDATRGYT